MNKNKAIEKIIDIVNKALIVPKKEQHQTVKGSSKKIR
jgi:hypothetical protein